ncbi:hypothetical protein Plim_4274 (plasmid) [Planctopirus limnophila DSM 3776]|uniref:Uncharacterized protein n=1 Tax=Planctopirus limnophila (strain ATCC 43296 / DSM 3776 / IFAM 1008 / Mu 290) TaxID=521674 RepID=D5SZG1_PLAL2|nr:hypothetical protein [Planctopirus limnophila]ADG70081.1 hypothetical protein Plim_4274 [Planctopirus limnophila DSM 3776]
MQRYPCAQNVGKSAGPGGLPRGPPEKIDRLAVVWIDHSVCEGYP